ncbi:MAG: methyltransferase domain-containing protein [candidate division Zixibacteria bacterium]|nr:methyltransferase domain-containing protein [candidate division Zixibacteria bacterium]
MPTSDPSNLTLTIQIVRDHYNASGKGEYSILSIGPGCGKFEVMFREYLDGCWYGRAFHDPDTWKIKIDGIEAWEAYKNPVLDYVCNSVQYGADMRDCTINGKYDLIWMGDVIEHVVKDEGIAVLARLKEHLTDNGIILISTPNYDNVINEPVYGNTYEVHKSRWFPEDFEKLDGFTARVIPGRAWTVVLSHKR